MDELKVATKGSLMNEIDFYKEENKNLKGLLEEVYEMSCLDDMINDLRSGEDDEVLLCHLSLKSQIIEALGKRKLVNNIKFKNAEASLTIGDLQKLNKHNGTTVVADHYSKEDK